MDCNAKKPFLTSAWLRLLAVIVLVAIGMAGCAGLGRLPGEAKKTVATSPAVAGATVPVDGQPGQATLRILVRWPDGPGRDLRGYHAQLIPDSTSRLVATVYAGGAVAGSGSIVRQWGQATASLTVRVLAGPNQTVEVTAYPASAPETAIARATRAGLDTTDGTTVDVELTMQSLFAPTISGMSPNSGAPGDLVAMTGTNLALGWAATPTVWFSAIGASVSAAVTFASSGSLTVVVPPGAASGSVVLTVDGETRLAPGSFTAFNIASMSTTVLPGAGFDGANAITRTSDGGFALGGDTSSAGAGGGDAYLVKLDAGGSKAWEKTYGSSADDSAQAVLQTRDGGFALFGNNRSPDLSRRGKQYLVKTDAGGNLLWQRTFGGADLADGFSFRETADSGFITVGRSVETDAWHDIRLTKVDSAGNQQWVKFFGRSRDDTGWDVQLAPDGGYIIAGNSGYWAASCQAWIIKTDSSGNKLWDVAWSDARYASSGYAQARGVVVTRDRGYLVVGNTRPSRESPDGSTLVLKLSSAGQPQWQQIGAGSPDAWLLKAAQRPDGTIVAVGHKGTPPDVLVLEMDEGGNALGERTFGGAGDDLAYGVVAEPNVAAIAGMTERTPGAGDFDAYFLRIAREVR